MNIGQRRKVPLLKTGWQWENRGITRTKNGWYYLLTFRPYSVDAPSLERGRRLDLVLISNTMRPVYKWHHCFFLFHWVYLNRSSNKQPPLSVFLRCKPYAHYWHSKLQRSKGNGGVKKNNNKKRTDKERRCMSPSVVCSTTFRVHAHECKQINGYPLAILVEIKETAGLGYPDLDAKWMAGIFGCNAIRVR